MWMRVHSNIHSIHQKADLSPGMVTQHIAAIVAAATTDEIKIIKKEFTNRRYDKMRDRITRFAAIH